MELDIIGMEFYNELQIAEFLIYKILEKHFQISNHEDNDTSSVATLNKENMTNKIIIITFKGVISINSNIYPSLNLHLKNYVRPFNRKRYTISQAQNFSRLLVDGNFQKLEKLLVLRQFPQGSLFQNVPRSLLALIFSFLSNHDLLKLSFINFYFSGLMNDELL